MQLTRFAGVSGFGCILASVTVACLSAEPYIKFGGATEANGWGKVHVELYHSDMERYGPYGSTTSLLTGELIEHNHLILDTGANAILFVAESAADLEATELIHGYSTEAQFEELGVAGLAYLNVSEAYGFDVIDSDGVRHSLPRNDDHVRVLSGSQDNLGLYNLANSLIPAPGIAGMPAMINRVTTFDPST